MSERIAIRCPDDIAAVIKERMSNTGKDKTTVVIEALRRGLEMPVADTEARLTRLEALVNERLEKLVAR